MSRMVAMWSWVNLYWSRLMRQGKGSSEKELLNVLMWQHRIQDLKIFLSKIQNVKKHGSEAKLMYNYLLLIQSTLSKNAIQKVKTKIHNKNKFIRRQTLKQITYNPKTTTRLNILHMIT